MMVGEFEEATRAGMRDQKGAWDNELDLSTLVVPSCLASAPSSSWSPSTVKAALPTPFSPPEAVDTPLVCLG